MAEGRSVSRARPNRPRRGLTYSDMAILVRAWKDAGPIVDALREAEIPYLGGGMNSLLDTPEAQAIREVFYFLTDHTPRGRAPVSEAALASHWRNGFPGLTTAEIAAGIKFLLGVKKRIPLGSDNQLFLQRVFLDLLEAMSVRERATRNQRANRRGDFLQLGKIQQADLGFRAHPFSQQPGKPLRELRRIPGAPSCRLLPRGNGRNGPRPARCGQCYDRAPSEGHAVAGRFHPVSACESIPIPAAGRQEHLAHHSREGRP